MPKFDVDEEVAALVERLADKRPFEHLSFNDALKRILAKLRDAPRAGAMIDLQALSPSTPKKAPSPSAVEWVAGVPDLSRKENLRTWTEVCKYLGIKPAGDSARRKLKTWVATNRPSWPPVPEV